MGRDFEDYFTELARPEPLATSKRELEALRYTSHGLTATECAHAMLVGRGTVEDALGRVRQKLGAKNTPHAVAIALRLGLID